MKVTLLNRPTLYTDYIKKWLYLLTGDVSWIVEGVVIPDCEVFSGKQKLGQSRKNIVTVCKGYAFDGMTNYPDTPQNIPDALLHDFLYQSTIVSRRDADRLLKASMSHNKTPRKWLVYSGVRLFGWACYGSENVTIKKL
jgi:hypothetical protein